MRRISCASQIRHRHLLRLPNCTHGIRVVPVAAGAEIALLVKQPPGNGGNEQRMGALFPGGADEKAEIVAVCAVGLGVAGFIRLFVIVSKLNQQQIPLLQSRLRRSKQPLVQKGFGASAVLGKRNHLHPVFQIPEKPLCHAGLGIGADFIDSHGAVPDVKNIHRCLRIFFLL